MGKIFSLDFPLYRTTYRKTLQIRPLQVSHTAHCSPGLPLTASFPGKTACKNQRAHVSFILTQMRARGDAAFLIGGLYLNNSYNKGLQLQRSRKTVAYPPETRWAPATVCATVVPFYRVTVKHLSNFTEECCVRATVLASHNEEVGHRETHADREFARELWNLSETLTGIYFQTEDFALFCCAL